MIIFVLFCIIGLLLLISWISLIKDSKRLNVPGPVPWPLIGNGHLMAVDSTRFLKVLGELAESYNHAVRIYLFSRRYVCLSHPKYIEPLVSSNELIVKGSSYNFLLPWLGQGLLTSTGQRWKMHRKFLTPAFHFNILQNFLPVFCKNEKILVKKLSKIIDDKPINLFPIIALAALDNVTESIMGVCVNAQENSESEYVKAIEELSSIVSTRMRNPFIANEILFNLLSYKSRQEKALKVLHGQTKYVIETRRQELKKTNITELPEESEFGIKNKHAFLDLLLLAEIDGERISDESIGEEVDTFMFEGHDTTTSGIVFSLYCIANQQEVQKKVLEEQKKIFGEDMGRDPTYNELHQMKYLELVIKESLRLYPSVPLIERLLHRDCDIAGLHILKNTSVIMNVFEMQRNSEIYEDPLEFRPERFELMNSKNAYNWLAFSAGPRNCIGQKFAMMELKVTLSGLIRRFELLPADIEPELCADLILRSRNGVHIKIKPRKYE